MIRKLSYGWRLVMTGFSFFVFWHGGLFWGWVVLPVVSVFTRDPEQRRRRCRRWVNRGFRIFLQVMRGVGVLRVRFEGLEHLSHASGSIIVANHPTLIDIIAIMSRLPGADCIVKEEMARHFFVRNAVRSAGFIRNDDPEAFIATAGQRIRDGAPLVIFPEGTRSPPGELRKFRRGAAYIAAETGCPILPVVITMTPPTLMKGQKWFEIPDRRPLLHLRFQEPVDPSTLTDLSRPRSLAAREISGWMKRYFTEKLHCECTG